MFSWMIIWEYFFIDLINCEYWSFWDFSIFLNCFNSAHRRKKIFSLKTCELLSALSSKRIIVLEYSEYSLTVEYISEQKGYRLLMSIFEHFIAPRSKKIIVWEFFELMSAQGSKKAIVLEHFEFFELFGLFLADEFA